MTLMMDSLSLLEVRNMTGMSFVCVSERSISRICGPFTTGNTTPQYVRDDAFFLYSIHTRKPVRFRVINCFYHIIKQFKYKCSIHKKWRKINVSGDLPDPGDAFIKTVFGNVYLSEELRCFYCESFAINHKAVLKMFHPVMFFFVVVHGHGAKMHDRFAVCASA